MRVLGRPDFDAIAMRIIKGESVPFADQATLREATALEGKHATGTIASVARAWLSTGGVKWV
jgi:hypothetical protein